MENTVDVLNNDPIQNLLSHENPSEFIKEVEKAYSEQSLAQLAKECKLSEVPQRIKLLRLKHGKTSALLTIKFQGLEYANTTFSVEVRKERMTEEQFDTKIEEHKLILFRTILTTIKLCAG